MYIPPMWWIGWPSLSRRYNIINRGIRLNYIYMRLCYLFRKEFMEKQDKVAYYSSSNILLLFCELLSWL
jgi:hypothetical protein